MFINIKKHISKFLFKTELLSDSLNIQNGFRILSHKSIEVNITMICHKDTKFLSLKGPEIDKTYPFFTRTIPHLPRKTNFWNHKSRKEDMRKKRSLPTPVKRATAQPVNVRR